MQLDLNKVEKIISDSLAEDIGKGDITSNLVIPENAVIKADFVTREKAILCGIPVLEKIFERKKDDVEFFPNKIEGTSVSKDEIVFTVQGNARVILAFERVALNLLQYMCGIASLTRRYAEAISHTDVKILDTRKTTPNLRVLAKYGVWIGGGKNHRFCLDDGILIKDNHLHVIGSIKSAIERAKHNNDMIHPIEVECENLAQVEDAIKYGADIILLDNMDIESIKKAVEINAGKAQLEASGGITLENLVKIAETGVNYISVGALTHSAKSIDIGLDIKESNLN